MDDTDDLDRDDNLDQAEPKRREFNPASYKSEHQVLRLLRCLRQACEQLCDEHDSNDPDDSCRCGLCHDVQGFLWGLNVLESTIASATPILPEDRH